jgi:hypothetical protein
MMQERQNGRRLWKTSRMVGSGGLPVNEQIQDSTCVPRIRLATTCANCHDMVRRDFTCTDAIHATAAKEFVLMRGAVRRTVHPPRESAV